MTLRRRADDARVDCRCLFILVRYRSPHAGYPTLIRGFVSVALPYRFWSILHYCFSDEQLRVHA